MQRNIISGVLLILLSGWIWYYSASFPHLDGGYPGPSLFPRLITIGLGLSGLILTLRGIKNRPKQVNKSLPRIVLGDALRLVAGIALVAAYPIFTQSIHFVPVMGGLILLFGLLLKNPAWHALFMAVLSAGLMYLMFTQLLGVPL